MSLKSKFKTDSDAAQSGVWVEYEANKDGTIPAFKLARMSKQNKSYTAAMRRFTEEHAEDDGMLDFSKLAEDKAEAVLLDVFIETVLLDWRNVQPDDDGVPLPYNKEEAKKLLGSPDWGDLYNDLNSKARKAATFRQKSLEAQAKNS